MEKNKQQTDIITDNFVSDIRTIIEQGRKQAYAATGQIAIMTYWNIGRRIVEEEQQGASRAAYGQKLIPALAVRLLLNTEPAMVSVTWHITESSIWNSRM